MTDKVIKSVDEWEQELSPEAFQVLRNKGTEGAFSGKYDGDKTPGTYHCAGCGHPLFSSEAKFDSGTGWPSFYEPVADDSVDTETDSAHGMQRTEVLCKRCGGHLGHVFEDGPEPTGQRYCMNSISLDLREDT